MTAIRHETFLFADLVGFSAFTEREGDEAAADVALRFVAEASELAAEHGARVVKCLGDAVMIHAPNASEAVQLGLRLRCEQRGERGLPPVHAGAHTGPAIERHGDWYGAAVNLAARVAAAAQSGELLLTEATVAGAGRLPDVALDVRGQRSFKNIKEAVSLFAASRRCWA